MKSRIAILLLAALACFACPASAGLPSPANWTVPPLIPVVGLDASGNPDPLGEFTIVARDLANNPMPGVLVTIDFSGCTDMRLSADPHDPQAIVNCASRTISKFTDAQGIVQFHVVGGSVGVPGSPGPPRNSAHVYGDGVLEASPEVAVYDLTNFDGMGPADLSAWLSDFFGGFNPERGDYDESGGMGPNDLSFWLRAFFAAQSTGNSGTAGHCPP